MALSESKKALMVNLLTESRELVANSSYLPKEELDVSLCLSSPNYRKLIKELSYDMQNKLKKVFKIFDIELNWPNYVNFNDLNGDDSYYFELFLDAAAKLHEMTTLCFDEFLGHNRHAKTNMNITNEHQNKFETDGNRNILKSDLQGSISKPQDKWVYKTSNDDELFKHRLTFKHNAMILLNSDFSEVKEKEVDGWLQELMARHPYAYEIHSFEYPIKKMKKMKLDNVKTSKQLNMTKLTLVNTVKDLEELTNYLQSSHVKEIAVDLEAHSHRSYQGFVCLMQISTRNEDFIIDTIELHDYVHNLNQVFTNPDKLKVFHGAFNDVKWLQRDFSIYVVNLFDTYHAARNFQFSSYSLANLLYKYIGVKLDKKFQLADWRKRPLSKNMLKYARMDTHYLLQLYDILVVEMLKADDNKGKILEQTMEENRKLCFSLYEKPTCFDKQIENLILRSKVSLSSVQEKCLRELIRWRDRAARENDESTNFVLPQHMMFMIAEIMPKDSEGVLACCNPVPELVKISINEIFGIIEGARTENSSTLNDTQPIKTKLIMDYLKMDGCALFWSIFDCTEPRGLNFLFTKPDNPRNKEKLHFLTYSEDSKNGMVRKFEETLPSFFKLYERSKVSFQQQVKNGENEIIFCGKDERRMNDRKRKQNV